MKIAIDAGHGSNTAGKRTPPFPYDIPEYGVKKGEQFREHIATAVTQQVSARPLSLMISLSMVSKKVNSSVST